MRTEMIDGALVIAGARQTDGSRIVLAFREDGTYLTARVVEGLPRAIHTHRRRGGAVDDFNARVRKGE